MKLVKVDRNSIHKRCKATKIQSMIAEFMNGSADCVELVFAENEYKSASACYNSWRKAVAISKRRCRVFMTDGKVYLEKLDT